METPGFPTTKTFQADESYWGNDFKPMGCPNCKQVFFTSLASSTKVCPNCGKVGLLPQPVVSRTESPELLIPFRVKATDLASIFTGFIKGVWLHFPDFNVTSLISHAIPVYWPAWLVDSDLSGDWQAEIGFDYQVKSSQETYGNGGWHSKDVLENRIRWEPRLGIIQRHYDNLFLSAVENQDILQKYIGTYQLDKALPSTTNQLQGTTIRMPDIPPEATWPTAQNEFIRLAGKDCSLAAKGNHVRNFNLHSIYSNVNWTLLLLPMYFSYYLDDAHQPHPVLINGQTGVIGGIRLASQKKGWQVAGISISVAFGLFLLCLLCFLLAGILPVLAFAAIFLAVCSFLAGLFAVIPAIWPWQWNRKQK